nr:polymorphic toxin type 30 domain-containing protein [Streptomyces sp. SS]
MRQLTPDSNGGAQKGVEYKWTDPVTGNTARLRVHDADGTAPPGSNAANGDVYRISIGGRYQDEAGTLYHRNVHKPASPHYDPDAANDTHIPWPSAYPLPY